MDEETQSPIGIGDKHPIHLFPDFNKEEMMKEMMPRWREKVEKRAEEKEEWELKLEKIYKKLGKEKKVIGIKKSSSNKNLQSMSSPILHLKT